MAENIDAERAAFITAYRLWTYEAHPKAHPEMVQFQAESHWGRAAGAMWLAARRIPSASTGEDGLPELPKQPEELRARWKCEDCDGTGEIGELIDHGYFQPPERARCTSCDGAGQVECEALLPEQVKEYARGAIADDRQSRISADQWAALEAARMHLDAARIARESQQSRLRDESPQAAQGVKRWQDRAHDMDGPYKQIELACEEIEQLRVQLARQSRGVAPPVTPEEVVAFIGNHYNKMYDANDVENIIFELTVHDLQSALRWWFDDIAAPPLSSEQQDMESAAARALVDAMKYGIGMYQIHIPPHEDGSEGGTHD